MKYNEKTFLLMGAFLLLGVVISVQFRSTLVINKEISSSQYTIDQMKKDLENEIELGNNLANQIKELEEDNENKLKSLFTSENDNTLLEIKEELDKIKMKAGLKDVKGEGIIVTLNDAPARLKEEYATRELIIHDADVYSVLNELKKAGAQAISINDERIIGTSKQVCAGPTILINNNRYAVPYVFKAIGNADELYDSLNSSKYIAMLREDSIFVEIAKSPEIVVKRYQYTNWSNLISGMKGE